MAYRSQSEQGSRTTLDKRPGAGATPPFRGINRSPDPSAIGDDEFYNSENMRRGPGGLLISRGGLERVVAASILKRIEGIHEASDIGAPGPVNPTFATCELGPGDDVANRLFTYRDRVPTSLMGVTTYDPTNLLLKLEDDASQSATSPELWQLGVDPDRVLAVVGPLNVVEPVGASAERNIFGVSRAGVSSVLFEMPSHGTNWDALTPVKLAGSIYVVQHSLDWGSDIARIVRWDGSSVTTEFSSVYKAGGGGSGVQWPLLAIHGGDLYYSAYWDPAEGGNNSIGLWVRVSAVSYTFLGTFQNGANRIRPTAMYSDGTDLWMGGIGQTAGSAGAAIYKLVGGVPTEAHLLPYVSNQRNFVSFSHGNSKLYYGNYISAGGGAAIGSYDGATWTDVHKDLTGLGDGTVSLYAFTKMGSDYYALLRDVVPAVSDQYRLVKAVDPTNLAGSWTQVGSIPYLAVSGGGCISGAYQLPQSQFIGF